MKTQDMLPLYRGAFALRACCEIVATADGAKPKLARIEVVEVLAVKGELVTWTNHKPSSFPRLGQSGVPFMSVCHRRELISLDAIEFPSSDTPATDEAQSADVAPL